MLRSDRAASVLLVVALGAGLGCRDRDEGADRKGRTAAPAGKAAQGGLAREVKIPWVSDDWAAAATRARAEKKPVFVDMWAPWCHTCLSMKQVVMVDPSLAPYLERFVWVEIDTDRPENADLVSRLVVQNWPTFYVVTAQEGREEVRARQPGSMSVAQLREFLDQGEQAHQAFLAEKGQIDPTSPVGMLQAGDAAAAQGDEAAAEAWYGKALAAAPRDWPRVPDVLVKQIGARKRGGDLAGCADLAMRETDRTTAGMTASAADFADIARQCTGSIDEALARLLRGRLSESVRAVVDAPDSAMSVDDQSDALRVLRELAVALDDPKTARAYAIRQRDLLDRAAASAPTPYARMTYNWPRAEVHAYLGEAAKLVPDLEQSVNDLPREYDPPYRLGWLYLQLGQLDKAKAMADRSLGLIYGPRKGRALSLLADIEKARGDVAAERAARQAVIDFYRALPPGLQNKKTIEEAEKALAAVGQPAPPK